MSVNILPFPYRHHIVSYYTHDELKYHIIKIPLASLLFNVFNRVHILAGQNKMI